MTRMIPITNGQGNCLRLAVALSPGFSSSGSVGGSFGLVAMVVTSCRPSTAAWVRRTLCLPSRLFGMARKGAAMLASAKAPRAKAGNLCLRRVLHLPCGSSGIPYLGVEGDMP